MYSLRIFLVNSVVNNNLAPLASLCICLLLLEKGSFDVGDVACAICSTMLLPKMSMLSPPLEIEDCREGHGVGALDIVGVVGVGNCCVLFAAVPNDSLMILMYASQQDVSMGCSEPPPPADVEGVVHRSNDCEASDRS